MLPYQPFEFGAPEFQKETGISDEVLRRFQDYAEIIAKWNQLVGLVGDSTLPIIWHRHFMDSAQLLPLLPKNPGRIADLGSGAGFPGLVLALMGVKNIVLFERNIRKAEFLQRTNRELNAGAEIINLTSEDYTEEPFDVLLSRAAAPLDELLYASRRLRKPSTICLFQKGKNLDAEMREAQKEWVMPDARRIPSLTDAQASILRLVDVVAV
ncbi:MAG TPA: 16S rRNA (guanine(527)-N(7))-methyltransferase RsmG [Alphaproteobacteria bacterium]|nr:16S rRNA (guanine(527)-N(7))-methyltransferase RsmG [Alphaproteobacteria bacterium]